MRIFELLMSFIHFTLLFIFYLQLTQLVHISQKKIFQKITFAYEVLTPTLHYMAYNSKISTSIKDNALKHFPLNDLTD